jgi:hypothetical protein
MRRIKRKTQPIESDPKRKTVVFDGDSAGFRRVLETFQTLDKKNLSTFLGPKCSLIDSILKWMRKKVDCPRAFIVVGCILRASKRTRHSIKMSHKRWEYASVACCETREHDENMYGVHIRYLCSGEKGFGSLVLDRIEHYVKEKLGPRSFINLVSLPTAVNFYVKRGFTRGPYGGDTDRARKFYDYLMQHGGAKILTMGLTRNHNRMSKEQAQYFNWIRTQTRGKDDLKFVENHLKFLKNRDLAFKEQFYIQNKNERKEYCPKFHKKLD